MSPSDRLPCPIDGCTHTRQPEHAFCVQHWRAVPHQLRKQVIAAWQGRRRAKSRLDAAISRGMVPADRPAVPRDSPLRREYAEAMRAHLQALEDAEAVVESRAPIDLFARIPGR